jgi:transcription elongation factor S-II
VSLDSNLLVKRAVAIEKQLFALFNQTVKEDYKSKIRSLALNLKSKTNPALREGVVTGEISIETLCTINVEVMCI